MSVLSKKSRLVSRFFYDYGNSVFLSLLFTNFLRLVFDFFLFNFKQTVIEFIDFFIDLPVPDGLHFLFEPIPIINI